MTVRTGIDADFVGEYGEWRERASPFLDQSDDLSASDGATRRRRPDMDDGVLEAVALRWVRRICDRPLPAGLEGVYDAERDEIVLSDRLSPIQRRCVLAHEISHARHHDVGGHGDAVTERRADIDAARILIDMGEYVTAEIVYGGDVCAMARELTVMPRTVRAYREWLHDNAAIHR